MPSKFDRIYKLFQMHHHLQIYQISALGEGRDGTFFFLFIFFFLFHLNNMNVLT